MTLQEVHSYGYTRTVLATTDAPVLQHPSYLVALSGQDDLVLSRIDDSAGTARVRRTRGGRHLFFERRSGELVAELTPGQVLALRPGAYRVRLRLRDRAHGGELSLRAGQRTELGGGALDEVPIAQAVRRGDTTERRGVLGLSAGGGVVGAYATGWGAAPLSTLRARLDLEPATVRLGLRWSRDRGGNAVLDARQDLLGLHLSALRHLDLRRASVGVGLRAGVDTIRQRFETTGRAPDRVAVALVSGPVARAELALGPRWGLGLDGGADIALLPAAGGIETPVVPHVTLDATLHAF